jgi:hypothetical protein
MNRRLAKLQNIMEANQRLNGTLLNEQNTHQPKNFSVGQTVNAKRDIDGKMYIIKITKTEPNYMLGTVTGPGTYKNEPLKGQTNLELYSDEPGQISGNTELGKFVVTP